MIVLVVAIDPGKVSNRVWLTTGERGLIGEPVSLPVLRDGVDELERLIAGSGVAGEPVIGIEATGALHRAWAAELERRWPGSLRLFAPSETQAARAQLGSRRFKTDDRDCAALVWLLRQGAGRPRRLRRSRRCWARSVIVASSSTLAGCVQQRLHDQLNALCPGLSAPAGHGRALRLETPTGQRGVGLRGRVRRPGADRPGRCWRAHRAGSARPNARFWVARWKRLLAPPADAELRAQRLGRDVERWLGLREDIAALEAQLGELLAGTDGQILTSLPGVAAVRAAGVRGAHAADRALAHAPSSCTRRPAWRRPATSRRRSRRRGRISRRACPSTATR